MMVLSAAFFLALSLMFGVMWVQMSVTMTVFRLLLGAAIGGAAGYLVAAPLGGQKPTPPKSPLTRGRLMLVLASLTLQALLIWGAATGRVFTWPPFHWLAHAYQTIPESWALFVQAAVWPAGVAFSLTACLVSMWLSQDPRR